VLTLSMLLQQGAAGSRPQAARHQQPATLKAQHFRSRLVSDDARGPGCVGRRPLRHTPGRMSAGRPCPSRCTTRFAAARPLTQARSCRKGEEGGGEAHV
jgi:hypothetical protein